MSSNFPDLSMATVGLSGGKLFLIVMILLVKYSEKACGILQSLKKMGEVWSSFCLGWH